MPTYIRPQRVTVIEGGRGFPLELAAGLAAAVAVALFVLAHWLFLAVGLAAVAVLTMAAVAFLRRYMVVGWAPRPQQATAPVQAIPAARPLAIEGGQHVHFHFHGDVSAGHAEAIRQAVTAAAHPSTSSQARIPRVR